MFCFKNKLVSRNVLFACRLLALSSAALILYKKFGGSSNQPGLNTVVNGNSRTSITLEKGDLNEKYNFARELHGEKHRRTILDRVKNMFKDPTFQMLNRSLENEERKLIRARLRKKRLRKRRVRKKKLRKRRLRRNRRWKRKSGKE